MYIKKTTTLQLTLKTEVISPSDKKMFVLHTWMPL